MTPEQFREKMKQIKVEFDEQEDIAHNRMDHLMCDVLVELGYGDGVHVFKTQEKWYA